ncbi:MAG: amidase family protein, partial [candidate division NC10 bacterium]
LDHVGVFTRSVADAVLAIGVLASRDLAPAPIRAPRFAIAPALWRRATPEIVAHLQATADAFARAGAGVTEVKLPASFDEIHAAGLAVMEAEAAAYHERDFGVHAGEYGPEMRKLIESGLKQTATAYVRANRARLAFREEMTPILAAHDALLSPTAPAPAPDLSTTGDGSLCAPWSYAGVPAISLPSGQGASGLPLAIQLVQGPGASARLLGAAAWCESQLAFSKAPVL